MWQPIESSKGYEASDDGQVRSPRRILKPAKTPQGYLKVVVVYLDGKQKQRTIHSLVAEAFIGLRPIGMDINHLNGDKADNRLANLEYCSRSQNMRHAVETGLMPPPPAKRGVDHYKSRLTEDQVHLIRKGYLEKKGIAQMAREFSVGESTIRNIVRGNSWGWLSTPA